MYVQYGILTAFVMGTFPYLYYEIFGLVSVRLAPFGIKLLVPIIGYLVTCFSAVWIVVDVERLREEYHLKPDDYIAATCFVITDIL